jgi:diguanylate cyclase (GGDEF)-like protein
MERLAEPSNPKPDLAKCALEPIQIIGHIQPHGLLFALSEPDLFIRHVSTNISAFLGMSPETLLGCSFETVLGLPQFEAFRSQILSDQPLSAKPLAIPLNGSTVEVHCSVHRYDGVLIAELELLGGAYSLEPLNLAAHIQTPIKGMEQAAGIVELSRLAAAEIQRLSGFDRTMVYRFDEDFNGEVIAEAVGSSPVVYLGSRFPESDIPKQARQIFLLNPSRSIADVDATRVPIIPEIGPLTGRALDLTRSSLRSASPIHLAYLRNMEVQSSMTVSIVVKQRLWGLMACHRAVPHRLDPSTRLVCELIVQVFASQLALRIDNIALDSQLTSRRMLENYLAGIESSESLVHEGHFQSSHLLDLLAADGMVSRLDGCVSYQGITVDENLLLPVIARLQTLSVRGIAFSNALGALAPSAQSYASQASGAMYIALKGGTGDYLLLLRRELVETVVWAGNPDKAINVDDLGNLHPRASFANWKEIVRGRSRAWSELEIENASFVRERLLRLREAQELHKSEKQVRYLASYDPLTGVLNRHSIHQKLDECVKEAAASGSSLAVLFIDLDHFKSVNDRYGHAVGDEILKITAKRMQHQLRPGDIVGRLGGDEFIVILVGLRQEDDALKVVARILSAVEKPLEIENEVLVRVTASIGLSRFPVDGTSGEALIKRSDMAMYRVKGGGGNAFELFRVDDAKGARGITSK